MILSQLTLAFIGPLPAWRWPPYPSPLAPNLKETQLLQHLPPCPLPQALHLLNVGGAALPPVPSTENLSEAPRWSSAQAQRDMLASVSSKRVQATLTHRGTIKHWVRPHKRAWTWICRLRRTDPCRRSSSVFADKSMLWASAARLLIYKKIQSGQTRVTHRTYKEGSQRGDCQGILKPTWKCVVAFAYAMKDLLLPKVVGGLMSFLTWSLVNVYEGLKCQERQKPKGNL